MWPFCVMGWCFRIGIPIIEPTFGGKAGVAHVCRKHEEIVREMIRGLKGATEEAVA